MPPGEPSDGWDADALCGFMNDSLTIG